MVDIFYEAADLPPKIVEDIKAKINELRGNMLEFKRIFDLYCIGTQSQQDGRLKSRIVPLEIKPPAYWITLDEEEVETFLDFLFEYPLDENNSLLDLRNAYICGVDGCSNLCEKLDYEVLKKI